MRLLNVLYQVFVPDGLKDGHTAQKLPKVTQRTPIWRLNLGVHYTPGRAALDLASHLSAAHSHNISARVYGFACGSTQ